MPKSQFMITKEEPKEEIASSKQLVDSFSTALQKQLKNVNDLLGEADKLTQMLATGEIENIHSVMIAAEKASIALNFTMTMRDKIIRAYEDTLAMGGR